jgi:cytochrome b561
VAALAKLARSAMATKALISAMLAFFIVRNLRMGCPDNDGLSNRHQQPSLRGGRRHFPGGTTVNMVSRYHPALVVLHWVMALLIIAALALGALVMVKIPNTDPMKFEALGSHMAGGMAILVLMLIRLVIRTRSAHPAPASAGHPLLDRLAWASHRLFYVTVFAMAGSGIIMALQTGLFNTVFLGQGNLPADFWAFPIRGVHYALSRLLMALIAVHIVAALYHALVLRDGLLKRMFFGRRTTNTTQANLASKVQS